MQKPHTHTHISTSSVKHTKSDTCRHTTCRQDTRRHKDDHQMRSVTHLAQQDLHQTKHATQLPDARHGAPPQLGVQGKARRGQLDGGVVHTMGRDAHHVHSPVTVEPARKDWKQQSSQQDTHTAEGYYTKPRPPPPRLQSSTIRLSLPNFTGELQQGWVRVGLCACAVASVLCRQSIWSSSLTNGSWQG